MLTYELTCIFEGVRDWHSFHRYVINFAYLEVSNFSTTVIIIVLYLFVLQVFNLQCSQRSFEKRQCLLLLSSSTGFLHTHMLCQFGLAGFSLDSQSPVILILSILIPVSVLSSQVVVEAKSNFVPSRVLGTSPPNISPVEKVCCLSQSAPRAPHLPSCLLVGHCRLLNTNKAHITTGVSDVCPECGVAPYSVEHLFNCQNHLTTRSMGTMGQPGCSCRLPQPGQLMIRDELLGYHNNNNNNNNRPKFCIKPVLWLYPGHLRQCHDNIPTVPEAEVCADVCNQLTHV